MSVRGAAIALALAPSAALPEEAGAAKQPACPAELENARQLVLITAKGMNAHAARMATFERDGPGAAWRPHSIKARAVIGAAGLGWGWSFGGEAYFREPLKVEGDRRSPAGFFPIGAPFGVGEAPHAGYLRLEAGKTFCVDDLKSPHYGRIVSKAEAGARTSGEDMAGVSLYRHGLIVDFPPNRTEKSGSCIFIHIWRAPEKGTNGCVAMAENDVKALQAWTRRGEAVLAVLPEGTLGRFAPCLPGAL